MVVEGYWFGPNLMPSVPTAGWLMFLTEQHICSRVWLKRKQVTGVLHWSSQSPDLVLIEVLRSLTCCMKVNVLKHYCKELLSIQGFSSSFEPFLLNLRYFEGQTVGIMSYVNYYIKRWLIVFTMTVFWGRNSVAHSCLSWSSLSVEWRGLWQCVRGGGELKHKKCSLLLNYWRKLCEQQSSPDIKSTKTFGRQLTFKKNYISALMKDMRK